MKQISFPRYIATLFGCLVFASVAVSFVVVALETMFSMPEAVEWLFYLVGYAGGFFLMHKNLALDTNASNNRIAAVMALIFTVLGIGATFGLTDEYGRAQLDLMLEVFYLALNMVVTYVASIVLLKWVRKPV